MTQTADTKEEIAATTSLGNEISKGEGGYKSYNTGTGKDGKVVHSGIKENMYSLTVDQLHESSKLSPYDRNRVFAAGKYQVITDSKTGTLLAAKQAMKLTGSEPFTPDLQEKIFMHFLIGPVKRPALNAYLERGKGTIDDAVYDAAKEWASIEVPVGRRIDPKHGGMISNGAMSYYQKKGQNSAIKDSGMRVRAKLEALRAAIAAAQHGGGTTLPKQPTPIVDSSEVTPTEQTEGSSTTTQTRAPTADEQKAVHPHTTPRAGLITASVGEGGTNHHADVGAVQQALAAHGHSPGAIDHRIGHHTINAIKAFQRSFMRHPDGLVEVGKTTAKHLAGHGGARTKAPKPVDVTERARETVKGPRPEPVTPDVQQQSPQQPAKQAKQQPAKPDASGVYRFGKYESSHPAGGRPGKKVTPKYEGSTSHQSSFAAVPVRPNVKLTPQIIRTATLLAPHLPRGTQMTSGVRDDEDQARVIMALHAPVQGDVYKTWLAAVVAGKKVNWVGESNHRSGLAMDFSGAPLAAIDAAVKKCKDEHKDANIANTVVEQNNNCLHVNVQG